MLYIFQVDRGAMMTFDMNLALESVSNLKEVISQSCRISLEKQVLLISGGYSLDPNVRVCNYSAGTDTNPIFLFNKGAIEAAQPPSPLSSSESTLGEMDLREQVEGCLNMPPTYNTVVTRAQLAQRFYEVAKEQCRTCERLVHDQHLMQQGWAAVVANLDDITHVFRTRMEAFEHSFKQYLESREANMSLLQNFSHDLNLLSRIPVLPALLKDTNLAFSQAPGSTTTTETTDTTTSTTEGDIPISLLHWLSAKVQAFPLQASTLDSIQDAQTNFEQLAAACLKSMHKFDGGVLQGLSAEVSKVRSDSDNPDMKEVRGLEERLFGLEQLMIEAKKTVDEQGGLAQALLQNQSRAGTMKDPSSVLPDLCASHRHQLQLMLQNHGRLVDIQRRCQRAKRELCDNLHARLRWIMFVEGQLGDLDNKLKIYSENLKRMRRHLDAVKQVHRAPKLYLAAVKEATRRRVFAKNYLQWAQKVSQHSRTMYEHEVQQRSRFGQEMSNHFLQDLLPGMEDLPPAFATVSPSPFDQRLPPLGYEDVHQLSMTLPSEVMVKDGEASSPSSSHPPSSPFLPPLDGTSGALLDEPLLPSASSEQLRPISEEEVLDGQSASSPPRTGHLLKAGSEPGGVRSQVVCGVEGQSSESISRAHSEGDIPASRKVDPSQPLEFLTADFYIDESMPSSYTESNNLTAMHKGPGALGLPPLESGSSRHAFLVAELQRQLEEKNCALHSMQEKLKGEDSSLIQAEERVSSLRDLLKEHLEKDRQDLSWLRNRIVEDRAWLFQECQELCLRFLSCCSTWESQWQSEKLQGDLSAEKMLWELRDQAQARSQDLQGLQEHVLKLQAQLLDFELNRDRVSQEETVRQCLLREAMANVLPTSTSPTEEFSKDHMWDLQEFLTVYRYRLQQAFDREQSILWQQKEAQIREEMQRPTAEFQSSRLGLENREMSWDFEDPASQTSTTKEKRRHSRPSSVGKEPSSPCILEASVSTSQQGTLKNDPTISTYQQTTKGNTFRSNEWKVSVLSCNVGDLVLLTYDEKHESYVVFMLGSTLHFLHTNCLQELGLNVAPGEPRRAWVLAQVLEKEFCKAKKFPNRYRVPLGVRFYRVMVQRWNHPSTE